MALFKKNGSLHQAHAAAHAVARNALGIFHKLADELERAADEHATVAVSAQAQINELSELRDAAGTAATQAARHADAVRSLVS